MNKLASLFAASLLVVSAGAFSEEEPAGPADPSQAGQTQPKGFVLIQRNIYVPVDAEGKVASQNWVVIDKQGFITAEELEKAASEATSGGGEGNGEAAAPETDTPEGQTPEAGPSHALPSLQKRRPPGEGPTILS